MYDTMIPRGRWRLGETCAGLHVGIVFGLEKLVQDFDIYNIQCSSDPPPTCTTLKRWIYALEKLLI